MSNLLDSFFSYERDLIYNCQNSLGIKMEEMVLALFILKKKFFQRLFHLLVLIRGYINEIFEEKRYRIHRDNPISTREIWESWPNTLKDLFLKKYDFYDIKNVHQYGIMI